jgi:hypothetical protein
MAIAKMYQIETPVVEARPKFMAGLKGQAKVVMDGLMAEEGPVLAKDLAEKLTFPGSKQDPYRVTLYYIIVFKGKGLVRAVEPEVEVEVEPTTEELEETIEAS